MRLLGFCLLGLFACSSDEFVATTDSGSTVGDSSPPPDSSVGSDGSGFDVRPIFDSAPAAPFCMGQNPTAIFCADWDKSMQILDGYAGGSPSPWGGAQQNGGASLTVTSLTSQSPPNALHAAFGAANGNTVGFLGRDFSLPSLNPHLGFGFKISSGLGPSTSIQLAMIVAHFTVGQDLPIYVQLTNGQDLHANAPSLGNGACVLGSIQAQPNAWHRAEFWLDRGKGEIGCRLDNGQQNSPISNLVLPPNLTGFGILVGVVNVSPNASSELNFDNVLLDGNPP